MNKPQKYVVVALGTTGDVYPFMAIALQLQARGHEVYFLANERCEAMVRNAGLAFYPVHAAARSNAAWANPALWDSFKGFGVAWRSVTPALTAAYEFIRNLAAHAQVVVVAHPFAVLGATLAKETLPGITLVSAYLAPGNLRTYVDPLRIGHFEIPSWMPSFMRRLFWNVIDRLIVHPAALSDINQWRGDLGLAPINSFSQHLQNAPDLSIALFPDWFAPAHSDWPKVLRSGDFLLYENRQAILSPALEKFLSEGEAPIVFTPGSAMQHGQQFFQTSLEICQRLNKRAIFLSPYAHHIPAQLPASIIWSDYVPFAALLQRVQALVHHGGIGTCAEALRAGVPQLIVPMAFDQFENACRIEALGVGLRFKRGQYAGEIAFEKLAALLSDPARRPRCREVAKRLVDTRAAQQICELIESVAPVPAPQTTLRSVAA